LSFHLTHQEEAMPMRVIVVVSALVWAAGAVPASAQAPAEPKIWTVLASAGLAVTTGNTDTSTVNLAYDIAYDPQTRNVIRSEGLWLRGETEGTLTTDRLGLRIRDEYEINARTFVFGQNQYLRDEFKSIEYLVAPTGGIGYRVFDTERTKLALDGAVGAVWEKNPLVDASTSGALALGEKLTQQMTETTTLTQSFSGLWKTEDLEDALFTFGIAAAASMSERMQLKVEFLDTFKNKPLPGIQKNDVAMLMAIVYKM
jgi:putative salt-induced outer membrane protein